MRTESAMRDLNLDVVKGVLVVVMIIYHTMNYFTTSDPNNYSYVRFVSGAFIFISGYIVSNYYKRKYATNRLIVTQRLIERGFKLLSIFLIVNIAIHLVFAKNYNSIQYGLSSFLGNLWDILFYGDIGLSAFEILLPIAYLLILSPVLLALSVFKNTLAALAAILIAVCSILKIDSYNLYSLLVGLGGFVTGLVVEFTSMIRLKDKRIVAAIIFIYISLMHYFQQNLIAYCVGIFGVLKLIYDFFIDFDQSRRLYKAFVILGQYSLFGYFLQILFLQALARLYISEKLELGMQAVAIMLITTFFILFSCIVLEKAQKSSNFIRTTYRAIFS
jgi:fucose 4-O-acetylase-like acetyltransferase